MTEQDIFEVRQTDVEIQEILDQVPKNTKAIEDINDKLPAEASPENPLADKEYVDGKVGGEADARQEAVNAEKTRAEGVEQVLQQDISTEAQTRQQADQTLDGKIAANTQAIANEQSRAEGAEQMLDGKIAAEKTRAEGAEITLQGNISSEAQARQQADQALDGKIGQNTQAIAAEKTRAEGVETTLQGGIDSINDKIPTQASSQNQLADKDFVNSTVGTNTATYISNNGQPFTSLAELQAYTGPHDNNDYAFVKTLDALGNVVYHRYKYSDASQQWALEYTLNNSSFTAAQWAAINSAITSGLTEKLNALPTKAQLDALLDAKQATISDLATIRSGAAAGATALQPAALTPYSTTEQMNAAIKTESDRAKQAEQANATDIAENAEAIAALQAIVADIETIAEGYVRVAGSSSPALSYRSYKYHEQGGFGRESVFSLFYPCLVGTKLTGDDAQVGTILFVLKKLGARVATAEDTAFTEGQAVWEDINGNLHAIDGSEGDVMVCNVEPYYSIDGRHTIDGTEYDVFLKSRTPFTWQGIEAVLTDKTGMSPDYCVSHQDEDGVTRMHSVYNPAWNGSYSAPVGVVGKFIYTTDPETGDIVETYDAETTLLGGAGGLHSTDINLPDGEQRAMNLNDDPTKTVPWMNQTAEGCNRLMSLILAEGGTFDAHNANLMGSGFSSNDPATAAGDWEQAGSGAKNGLRVMDKDGAWKNYGLAGNVRFLTGATEGTVYAANVINSWRNPWHIMEAHRAMSYAIENDVHELEWFVFEGNKYKYRSVQGFNGPSHGEMTCVVWKLMATQAGANAIDPTDNATSIAGNRVEILVSTALIHGVTTQVSPSWWVSGLIFTEDEHGQYECYIERDQQALLKSPAGDYAADQVIPFEEHYEHLVTIQKGEGYARNYHNDALMMPDTNANKTGAGLHTYVGKYNWFTGGNAPAGKRGVRGFRRGTYAYNTNLSPLSMNGYYSPSGASSAVGFGTCCSLR